MGDPVLVSAIEYPLSGALGAEQARLGEHAHMLAERRLGDAELLGDQLRADAVLDQIAVGLVREMRARILQPIEDLQPALVGDRLEDFDRTFAIG